VADRVAHGSQAGVPPVASTARAPASDGAIVTASPAQSGAAGVDVVEAVDPVDVEGVDPLDAAVATDAASSSCCLEHDLKWQLFNFGWSQHYWRLAEDGTLERRPIVDERERGTPYVGSAADLADAGLTPTVASIALPPCGEGKVCLRDVRDVLAHTDVTAVLPQGHDFPNGAALDGPVFFMFLGDTEISFGAPPYEDLPAGFKALYALLGRLELEHLQASLPSCSTASRPATDCNRSAPACVYSWYLGALIEFADCAAAERCERDARERAGYGTDEVVCTCAVLGVCETVDAGP
jgi:hypothetical protein